MESSDIAKPEEAKSSAQAQTKPYLHVTKYS